ncbi:hypothetical protein LSPH24S_08285 [Lysinibacillus sphaericus]
MGTRVSYPYEVKMKAIKMRLAGVPVKQILLELNIRHKTQVETWVRWYRNGEVNRLKQPVGKPYILANLTPTVRQLEKMTQIAKVAK